MSLTYAAAAWVGRRCTANANCSTPSSTQLRAGGAWPLLPHDLPPWRTVYKQFEAWREDGTWDRLLTGLRQQVRQLTREAEPMAGAIDSQSVRTGSKRGALTATMPASK